MLAKKGKSKFVKREREEKMIVKNEKNVKS